MPFINTGELFDLFGTKIHIGVNIFALLMLAVAVFAVSGLIGAIKQKNLLGMLFGLIAALAFGFFALATIFTYGYPILHH
ncbi:DUF2759 family protein [Macrococcus equipercicus]|uniref:DUF2759 family protein n=1 Tax=Macrococcus equipercicus TaxID=69967 RepID=A0A9Q9BU04_9STAP|nr:DUF2759 family protein [Macrococcus equipercicus]KAA1040106.1 DUF2759 family protein [Macrococcus equipercicus]UTH12947.1 DUF2759 family protein [Macrococcus equipercicus]